MIFQSYPYITTMIKLTLTITTLGALRHDICKENGHRRVHLSGYFHIEITLCNSY